MDACQDPLLARCSYDTCHQQQHHRLMGRRPHQRLRPQQALQATITSYLSCPPQATITSLTTSREVRVVAPLGCAALATLDAISSLNHSCAGDSKDQPPFEDLPRYTIIELDDVSSSPASLGAREGKEFSFMHKSRRKHRKIQHRARLRKPCPPSTKEDARPQKRTEADPTALAA